MEVIHLLLSRLLEWITGLQLRVQLTQTLVLFEASVRTDFTKCGFCRLASAVWNSLPWTVHESPSLTLFKSRLKMHLLSGLQYHTVMTLPVLLLPLKLPSYSRIETYILLLLLYYYHHYHHYCLMCTSTNVRSVVKTEPVNCHITTRSNCSSTCHSILYWSKDGNTLWLGR